MDTVFDNLKHLYESRCDNMSIVYHGVSPINKPGVKMWRISHVRYGDKP